MKPSRIVLLLVALLAGGLAAFLATRGNRPADVIVSAPQVIQEAKTQILVAVAPIGVGERLSTKTVSWQDWPEGAVRPEYISVTSAPDALTTLSGAVARFEMFPGDPILERKIVRTEQGYLSAVLEKGKRGVSINVNAASASGGYIVPNDRVDVVLTHAGPTGQISETILENVKVLAIGARLGEAGATGAANPDDPQDARAGMFSDTAIATLELDPVQGETIINASKIGPLSLALRSITDFSGPAREITDRRSRNQAIRVIRYGVEQNIMAGTATSSAPGVDPATFIEPISPSPPQPTVTISPSAPVPEFTVSAPVVSGESL
jgi:pilus assembly protein CpaB